MNKKVIENILSQCKKSEKIIIKIFNRTIIKTYKIGVKDGFNWSERK